MNLTHFTRVRPKQSAFVETGVPTWSVRIAAAAIASCLLLQLHLVFTQPINWDEFRFLADIHSYTRGQLSDILLTFQVHLFGWLIGLGNEVEQIRIARLVMLTLETGTLYLIWLVSRRFFEPAAALFSALCYVSFSFVLQHGASFRFDPIATFLAMVSIALLLRARLRAVEIAIVGLALALAMMVTVKTVLMLPVVIAVAVYRIAETERRREMFIRLTAAAVASALFLALLYFWHLGTLAGATNGSAQQHLNASYAKTLADTSLFPRISYLVRSITENPLHWVLLLLGVSGVMSSYKLGRARALLILAFLLPLFSVAIYRNAFPYYYAFMLAPGAVLWAAAAGRTELRKYVWLAAVVLFGFAFVHHQRVLSTAANDQERTVAMVHAMFPQPVSYIDRCSMIASFPQAGLFMSSWWIENYAEVGRPVMREILANAQPAFVIANSPHLIRALQGERAPGNGPQLMYEDQAALQSNYVHQWGPIWIAGKALPVTASTSEEEFLIAGNYRLESRDAVVIDGVTHSPGMQLAIGRGLHRFASPSGPQFITLRWAEAGRPPSATSSYELGFGRF